MKKLPAICILLSFFACSTPRPKDVGKEPPAVDMAKEPTPAVTDAKDLRWEEDCLVYPKQDVGHRIFGRTLRRDCSSAEIPDPVAKAVEEGFAADEKTALALARVLVSRVYGDRVFDSSEPKIAQNGDRWVVQWEVPSPEPRPDALKRLSVEIVKKTGGIARLWVSVVKE